jgi:hypothetical protein
MKYLTVLGDSTLDNASYVPVGESTFCWLRRFAPLGWDVILAATDGAVLSSISLQARKVHPLTKAILLSVGGNDAYGEKWRLGAFKGKKLWRALRVAAADFGLRYERLLDDLSPLREELTISTIYGGDFGEDQNLINAAVSLFNRQISRLGGERGIRVLDLYSFLKGKEFFTSTIEPSSLGSATLAHHFWKGLS